MKPEAPLPWRKTLRAEAKGVSRKRRTRDPEPDVIRRGSTWLRRHLWMSDDERRAAYEERCAPSPGWRNP